MTVWWAPSLDPFRLHHPVLPNRVSSRQVQIGRFVPGFAQTGFGSFWSRGPMLSLAAISVALSLHPKIPFLADKAQRLTSGSCRTGARPRRRWQAVSLGRGAIVAGSTRALRTLRGRLGHQITGTTARPFLHFLNPTRRPRRVSSRLVRRVLRSCVPASTRSRRSAPTYWQGQ